MNRNKIEKYVLKPDELISTIYGTQLCVQVNCKVEEFLPI